MTTIKGQNLRILVTPDGGTPRCIAAALQCTVHAALQLQEDTTKDTDNDWIDQEPVGVNWDVSGEAVVLDGVIRGEGVTSADIGGISPVPYYGTALLSLPAGKTITARSLNYHGDIIIGGTPPITSALAAGTNGFVRYTNSGSSAQSVVVGTPYNDAKVEWYILEDSDATYIDELIVGQEYDLVFALTHGSQNRQTGTVTKGNAIATNTLISIAPIQYYGPLLQISVPSGKALTVITPNHNDNVIVVTSPPSSPALATGDNGRVTFVNTGSSAVNVAIGCPYQNDPMVYYIHEADIMQVVGKAILNDLQWNAPNQDYSTANVKFTGNGELTLLL